MRQKNNRINKFMFLKNMLAELRIKMKKYKLTKWTK